MELQTTTRPAPIYNSRPLRRKRPVRNLPEPALTFPERLQAFRNLVAKLVEDCNTPEERFRSILLARGFLLEEKGGRLFLSSNSDPSDFGHLDKLLSSKKLGYFSRNGQNVSGNIPRLEYDYGRYSGIWPEDEIVLTNDVTFDDLLTIVA